MAISNSNFTHLHVHSEYSQFDGLAKVDDLVMAARKMGFTSLALTDHGTIAGIIKFFEKCNLTEDKKGKDIPYPTIKPIMGIEAYMSQSRFNKDKNSQPEGRKGNYHLILLAKNYQGYRNLCALSHKSNTEGFYTNPRIDFDLLNEHSEGLICQTACLKSIVNQNLLYDRYDEAKKACRLFKDIFGEDFFLEVMYHGIPGEGEILSDIFKLGSELDIPIVASNDSHYVTQDQAKSQEVLMCMSTRSCLSSPKHLKFPYGEFYLKSAEEMLKVFKSCPEVVYNTQAVVERIDNESIRKNLFGVMRLPSFDIPDGFKDPHEYLESLAREGMKKLGWDQSKKHIEALNMELEDVKVAKKNNNYDFATYFLIVWDYMKFAKEKGIFTAPGRGSGYASVLLRCLEICYGPDPLEYGALWARFLGFSGQKFIIPKDFGFC